MRPAGNTGTGFFVLGTGLYDAEGVEFRIQGVNANHWWNNGDDNRGAVPYIKATGANAARLVFGEADDSNPYNNVCKTNDARRLVVEEYIKYRIVPIVEYHNGTGSNDPAMVDEAVDFWIGEDWLGTYERYVIVNITNEWCTNSGGDDLWYQTYLAAIGRLREKGVKNALLIDSINWASSVSAVERYGAALLEADPQHNLLFSLHMYGGWRAPGDPDDDYSFYMNVDEGLARMRALGLHVIVGEFNHVCAIEYDAEAAENEELLDAFDEAGAGWLCWMWYNSSGSAQNMVYSSESLVYTDFGTTIKDHLVESSEATCFPSDPVPTLPTPPVPDPDWRPEGPLSIVVSNSWWMEASLPDMNGISSIAMEGESGGGVSMSPSGWGPFRLSADLSAYLNQRVRFVIRDENGSEALTEYGVLNYTAAAGDDYSSFEIAE